MRSSGQQVSVGSCTAFVRHVLKIQVGQLLEHFSKKLWIAATARGCIAQRPRLGFGQGDEFAHSIHAQRGRNHHDELYVGGMGDGGEALDGVVTQIAKKGFVHHM